VNPAPPDPNVTRYILIAITLVALAAIIWTIADVFVIAFGAIVFATVLRALAEPLAKATGWRERWALAAVVGGLLIVAGLLSWLFGRQAMQQFVAMREQLPAAVEKFQHWVGETELGRMALDLLKQTSEGGNPLANAGVAFSAALGGVGNVLLIIFAGIYLAGAPRLYRNGALRLLPPSRRPQVGRALDDAGVALRKWLVAQIVVMVAVGVLTGIGLGFLGVPLSLSLALLAGLLEFVPVVGPIAAAIPGVLLAFSVGPQTAFYALVVYIAVQQIESNLLTPLVQRWAVELPPVIALLSIVACGLLFGVMGVIFATPMAVVVMAMVQHLYVEDTLENGGPDGRDLKRNRPGRVGKTA
jgi:predicted PurR-regulated permease PerM